MIDFCADCMQEIQPDEEVYIIKRARAVQVDGKLTFVVSRDRMIHQRNCNGTDTINLP